MNLYKNSIIFYARCIPKNGLYEVCELKIRTVNQEEGWIVGVDKRDKRAYLLTKDEINKKVFEKRKDALDAVLLEEDKNRLSGEE